MKAVSQADILVLSIPLSELRETLMIIGDEGTTAALVLDLTALKGPGVKWSQQYLGRALCKRYTHSPCGRLARRPETGRSFSRSVSIQRILRHALTDGRSASC
ncbi:MAG: hypothetical protein R3C44_22925 [Chloroflexota bacterium]